MSEVAVPPPAPAPSFLGQATAVEQSRAVAEVQAAVVVARQNPRSVERALSEMRETFRHKALAERSFYAYTRAGQNIVGPSIHLARELARVWENIQYGINELRRDDVKGESEMIAWAWDLQANIRSSTTFIVKHARDTKQGRKPITELRDVYENNANNGARRVREMILAVVPSWFSDEAKELARKTLADGGSIPLPARRANTIKAFSAFGVTETQLVGRFGPVEDWGDVQLANMAILGRSLRDRETTVEEAFPRETERVTRADLGAPEPPAGAPATEPAPAGAADQEATRPATGPQKRDIVAARKALGLDGDDTRDVYEALLSEALGRTITSSNDLSFREAKVALAFLQSKVASAPPATDTLGPEFVVQRGETFGFTEAQVRAAAEELYARPLDELDKAQLQSLAMKITYRTITPPPEES
jgi:hypothetical protein